MRRRVLRILPVLLATLGLSLLAAGGSSGTDYDWCAEDTGGGVRPGPGR